MSYDVTVGTQDFNYTANMGKFFTDFGVSPRQDLEGLTPRSAMIAITAALYSIATDDFSKLTEEYNAPNGWGDVEGATRFLFDIYMACLTEPDVDTVEVS